MTWTTKKVFKIIYDHWLVILPLLIPLVGTALLWFWDKFRELMLISIPFWVLLISLFIVGSSVMINIYFYKQNQIERAKNESPHEAILLNNLFYKEDKKQAFCPKCYENGGEYKRMKREKTEDSWGDYYRYTCFVCDHQESVREDDEINPIIPTIPF